MDRPRGPSGQGDRKLPTGVDEGNGEPGYQALAHPRQSPALTADGVRAAGTPLGVQLAEAGQAIGKVISGREALA